MYFQRNHNTQPRPIDFYIQRICFGNTTPIVSVVSLTMPASITYKYKLCKRLKVIFNVGVCN